jgi:hypothetical protein
MASLSSVLNIFGIRIFKTLQKVGKHTLTPVNLYFIEWEVQTKVFFLVERILPSEKMVRGYEVVFSEKFQVALKFSKFSSKKYQFCFGFINNFCFEVNK